MSYRIVLPPYDPAISRYRFELVAQHFGLRSSSNVLRDSHTEIAPQTLASGEHNSDGVPVLLLPDPIGMVQEYNHLRARLLTNRQEWAAEIKRSFQWFTSKSVSSASLLRSYG